jgi:hypothetical protein
MASRSDLSAQANLLFVMVAILEQAKLTLSHKELVILKEHVFQSGKVRELSEQLSPLGPAQKGFALLLLGWKNIHHTMQVSMSSSLLLSYLGIPLTGKLLDP